MQCVAEEPDHTPRERQQFRQVIILSSNKPPRDSFKPYRRLLQVGKATLAAREVMIDARKKEAEKDKEGVETESVASPGEAYSSSRVWISEEYRQAEVELRGMNGYIKG